MAARPEVQLCCARKTHRCSISRRRGANQFTAQVLDCLFMGETYQSELRVGEYTLNIYTDTPIPVGTDVTVAFPQEKLSCLEAK